jgi:hypothetical protein
MNLLPLMLGVIKFPPVNLSRMQCLEYYEIN